jgi:AcrR family transcriptional regulator
MLNRNINPSTVRAATVADAPGRSAGRPRDPAIDAAILDAAKDQLAEHGYDNMSLEKVAAAACTTTPSLRRRYKSKAELAVAAVASLRFAPLPTASASPRRDALAILDNFRANALRPHAMTTVGTLLAHEARHPELLDQFRHDLIRPRRNALLDALERGIRAGQLSPSLDVDEAVNMLVGGFYARYLAGEAIPRAWAERALELIWPTAGPSNGRPDAPRRAGTANWAGTTPRRTRR